MNLKSITAAIICMSVVMSVSAQNGMETKKTNKYAKSVLSLAPVQLSENGVAGVGVSYERTLDKEGIISFYVPATVVLNTNSEQRLGSGAHYSDPMVYVMPGIKLYPTGNQGLTKYAIGPSLVFAKGNRTEADNNPFGYNQTYITRDHTIIGMMVNQSININPTPHLYIGSEFGFGYSYMNRLDGINQNTTGLVQFSFKIGYRY